MLPSDVSKLLRTEAGPIYSITVEAITHRGARGRVEAVIWIAPDQGAFYRVLDWREGAFDRRETKGENPA